MLTDLPALQIRGFNSKGRFQQSGIGVIAELKASRHPASQTRRSKKTIRYSSGDVVQTVETVIYAECRLFTVTLSVAMQNVVEPY